MRHPFIHTAPSRLAAAFVLLGGAAFAQETPTAPEAMNVEQISTHMGEMTYPIDSPADVDDSLIFEPFQSMGDMFGRDDVVYLMRHGPTDWSKLDEYEVAPTDCANQRIMSPEGRANMRDLGALMAVNDILPSQIVVSEWCRNQQTVAEFLTGIGRVDATAPETMPVETDGNLNLLLSLQGAPDVTDLRARISNWQGDPDRDRPLLLISHFTNIEELTQFRVFEGEIVVIDPKRDNRVLGYLRLRSAGPDVGHFAETLESELVADDRALDMVGRYYDALNTNDAAMLDQVLSDRWVVHGVAERQSGGERDTFLDYVADLRSALDGARFDVQDIHVASGVVTVIGKVEGRHTGPLFGVAPTGRDVSFDGIAVHRIEDGRIVETWQMADRLDLLRQIGG
ncbi:ester cyclase [Palleronia rufa]|uniref:ester cyclase n=1 Tax=Palleronia rufa TaxID=1530186 RepID=UPI00068C50FF|nr:ester cyclase [Palleronia rufa]